MSGDSSISVVIPTYNRAAVVGRAIDSALRQTRPAAEIIVVDDGSTDGTADLAASYGSAVRYVTQANGGVSAARNRGIELASGEWVAFLDSDDEWLPGMLEAQSEALARFPGAVAGAANGVIRSGGPDRDFFSGRRLWRDKRSPVVSASGIAALLLQPVTSGVVVRRDVLEAAGRFDPSVREFEDFDLWSRVSLRGSWVVSNEPLWIHFRESLDATNVSEQYWARPVDACGSLLRSCERMRVVRCCDVSERFRLRQFIGHYRGLMGALTVDSGVIGGRFGIMRSLVDWPSPRGVARAIGMLCGWRPMEIRRYSRELVSARLATGA